MRVKFQVVRDVEGCFQGRVVYRRAGVPTLRIFVDGSFVLFVVRLFFSMNLLLNVHPFGGSVPGARLERIAPRSGAPRARVVDVRPAVGATFSKVRRVGNAVMACVIRFLRAIGVRRISVVVFRNRSCARQIQGKMVNLLRGRVLRLTRRIVLLQLAKVNHCRATGGSVQVGVLPRRVHERVVMGTTVVDGHAICFCQFRSG